MLKDDRLKQIEKMLSKNKNDSFLVYAAALEYKKHGDKAKSISLLEKLIKQDPNYLGTYYQLGKIYEEEQQDQKAIDVYKKGLKVAREVNDNKTYGELSEALMFLDDDYDGSL